MPRRPFSIRLLARAISRLLPLVLTKSATRRPRITRPMAIETMSSTRLKPRSKPARAEGLSAREPDSLYPGCSFRFRQIGDFNDRRDDTAATTPSHRDPSIPNVSRPQANPSGGAAHDARPCHATDTTKRMPTALSTQPSPPTAAPTLAPPLVLPRLATPCTIRQYRSPVEWRRPPGNRRRCPVASRRRSVIDGVVCDSSQSGRRGSRQGGRRLCTLVDGLQDLAGARANRRDPADPQPGDHRHQNPRRGHAALVRLASQLAMATTCPRAPPRLRCQATGRRTTPPSHLPPTIRS